MNLKFGWLILAMPLALFGSSPSTYRLLKEISIAGPASWDYVSVDSENRRVYLSHESEVIVLDADSQNILGKIPDVRGAHGIAIASEFGRGFISAGLANSVVIFDLKTLKTVGVAKTEKKPDCILYDSATKRVFAMDGASNNSTVISPSDGNVVATVSLGGAPEFSVSDDQGHIYINLKDQNQVARVDSKALSVTDHWPTTPCASPTSLALDESSHRLFVGCRSRVMAIMDAQTGKVLGTYPIGDHVDATVFDPASRLIFNSSGDGTVAVFHQDSADTYSLRQMISTRPGSKTMGLDLKTQQLFIPANLDGKFNVMIYGQ
jgi:DNA-binding beta-propeller fold protein YncE